jgi:hypothetical protein
MLRSYKGSENVRPFIRQISPIQMLSLALCCLNHGLCFVAGPAPRLNRNMFRTTSPPHGRAQPRLAASSDPRRHGVAAAGLPRQTWRSCFVGRRWSESQRWSVCANTVVKQMMRLIDFGGGPHYLCTLKGYEGTLWKEMRPHGGRHTRTVEGCPFPNYTD